MEKELFEFLTAQDYVSAVELVNKYTPEQLSDVLQELEKADIPALCREINSDLLADALLLLPPA